MSGRARIGQILVLDANGEVIWRSRDISPGDNIRYRFGEMVEVDITLTLTVDAVMESRAEVFGALLGIEGISAARVDDLPSALVTQQVKRWMSDPRI